MKRRAFSVLVVIVLSVAAMRPGTSAAQDLQAQTDENGHPLHAGIAKIDIMPDKPVRMSGYSGRKDPSTGVHDRLYARVVVFESGDERLVLVSTDLIGFDRTYEPIRDALCDRFDLEPSEVFLSSTHAHSG